MTTARNVLAADIGGTLMRAAVVDAEGRVLARDAVATEPERGIDDAARRLAALFGQVTVEAGEPPIAAAGVSTAGPLDPITGTYRYPPNLLGWHGASMRPVLEPALGVPVAIGHDATLAALAEAHYGQHRGSQHLVYLTVSTGIGAGIFAHGRPITGHSGGAGEAGHMIVQPGGPSCGAGCPGCLEGVSSGSGIAAAARRAVAAGAQTTLTADAEARDVFAAAAAGDTVAREIIEQAIEGLATGLAGLLALLDPEMVVLGGGVMRALEPWWDRLLARTQEIALPRYTDGVPVARTALGDDASLLGASVIAFEALHR